MKKSWADVLKEWRGHEFEQHRDMSSWQRHQTGKTGRATVKRFQKRLKGIKCVEKHAQEQGLAMEVAALSLDSERCQREPPNLTSHLNELAKHLDGYVKARGPDHVTTRKRKARQKESRKEGHQRKIASWFKGHCCNAWCWCRFDAYSKCTWVQSGTIVCRCESHQDIQPRANLAVFISIKEPTTILTWDSRTFTPERLQLLQQPGHRNDQQISSARG